MGRKIKPGCNEILYWEVSFFLHAWNVSKTFLVRFSREKNKLKNNREKKTNKQNKTKKIQSQQCWDWNIASKFSHISSQDLKDLCFCVISISFEWVNACSKGSVLCRKYEVSYFKNHTYIQKKNICWKPHFLPILFLERQKRPFRIRKLLYHKYICSGLLFAFLFQR